jgi:hypothetical protein
MNSIYTHPSMPGTPTMDFPHHITALPDRIIALPVEEQGPALVAEIHDRKGRTP